VYSRAEAPEKPEADVPKADAPKAETGGGSLFDFPSPGQEAPTPSEKAQAEAVAEEEPVTSEPENAPTAAEAKGGGTAPVPGTEIGTGSLFDIAPPEGAPTHTKVAEPVDSVDAADEEEPSDEGGAPAAEESATEEPTTEEPTTEEPTPAPQAPKPASSGEAHQPATDKKITEGGSLFDL